MNQTEKRYQQKLDQVTDYIYANLEKDIRIDTLAEVACLSPYHWHRVYKSMRGETIATTIKRLRLQRAADRLANSDLPIADIASRSQYTTIESFNRAFKAEFNLPPAAYRERGSHAQFKNAMAKNNPNEFNVNIIDFPETLCAAVPHTGSYMQIDQAMGKLFVLLKELNLLNENTKMMALFLDDPELTETEALRSFACSPIEPSTHLPTALETKTLKARQVAKLTYKGPYADMSQAYQWLYGVWLPESGYEPADSPCIESYLNNPQQVAPTELLTDIMLPLAGLS